MFSTANLAARSADNSPRVERRMVVAVFFVSLALIAFSKWGQWHEIPYWDAACGVFPAAITLTQTSFDYPSLLSAPAYLEGGPNVHATSSITLLTAIAYQISGDPWGAFLILHWIHYLIAALTIALLYLWSAPVLGKPLCILLAGAMLLCPLFLTQAGHMYLELPMACTALLALLAYEDRRIVHASCWALLAVSIKEPGLIVAGTLVVLAALDHSSFKARLKRIAIVAVPSVLLAVGKLTLYDSGGADKVSFTNFVQGTWYYLTSAPDVLVVFAAAVLAASYRSFQIFDPQDQRGGSMAEYRLHASAVMIAMFSAFFLTLASLGWIYMLLRYFVMVFPFIFLLGCDLSKRILGGRATVLVLILFCVTSIANYNGRFYQYVMGNNGAIAERSNEYVNLLKVHRDSMSAAEKVASNIPILCGLPEHYFSQYPSMGYVQSPLKNVHCILLVPRYSVADLDTLPDHFFLLYSFVAQGGDKLNWLKTQALANPEYSVSQSVFRHGHYQAQLIEVRRTKLPSPRPSSNAR